MVDSWFLSFPIIIGLAVCVLTDQLQLVAKVNGSLKNKVAGGYNSAMKIMVVNRLGAVLYFFTSSLYIESAANPKSINIIYILGILLSVFLIGTASLYYLKTILYFVEGR